MGAIQHVFLSVISGQKEKKGHSLGCEIGGSDSSDMCSSPPDLGVAEVDMKIIEF